MVSEEEVMIDYTSWRGIRSTRFITPVRIFFGNNKWHHEPQWLLEATDEMLGESRTFAIANIHSWAASARVAHGGKCSGKTEEQGNEEGLP